MPRFIDILSARQLGLQKNEDGTTLPSLVEDTHEPLGIVTGVLREVGHGYIPGNLRVRPLKIVQTSQKERIVFQAWFFRGELLNFLGGVS